MPRVPAADLASYIFRDIAPVTTSNGKLPGAIRASATGPTPAPPSASRHPRGRRLARQVAGIVNGHHREDPTAISFWGALSEAERRAFTSVASERTFARGTRLMEEGQQSRQVMVIRKGWTRICIREDGLKQRERTVARRGPGQLIGERAALEKTVRSASVIADEAVRALVVSAEDFTAFLSAHPAVRDMVEGQLYRRAQQPSRPLLNGQNCTIVHTDIVGFSQRIRTDEHRRTIRLASLSMTMKAIEDIYDACSLEDRGDGVLMVVRPEIPTGRVLESLLSGWPAALRRHNETFSEALRIQLRIAIDVGPVVSDEFGISGDAIIRTARLLDAADFKTAMKEQNASLGIIVSTFVYDAAVPHPEGAPAPYVPVQASVKESSIPAWMQIITLATSLVSIWLSPEGSARRG
jgi:CRP-like cAMP-binding protein